MDSKTAPEAPPTDFTSQLEITAGSRTSPLDRAGILSLSTMSWMSPVMWSMSRKQLDLSSLCLSPVDGAAHNGDRLQKLWEQEVCDVGLQKASLTRVLLRFQGNRLLLALIISSLHVGYGILVHAILSYVVHPEMSSVLGGVALCAAVVSVEIFRVGCLGLSWALNLRTGIRLKAGFCMLGFNKILSLRTLGGVPVGQKVQVLTSDSYRVFEAMLLGPLVLPFPLLLLICSTYCCYILDYTVLVGFLIFLLFILLQAFPVVTIFNCMRFILSMLPTTVKVLAEAAVSVSRLKRLLLIENPKSYLIQKTGLRSAAIIIDKATLSWMKPPHPPNTEGMDDLQKKSSEATPTLRNISFTLDKGKLLGVCGNVGSGKTSLICSLLGQMHLHQGSISVDGSIAYASQQPWIFYGTVQDNILMGEPLDRSRYSRVLSSCNLETDLQILPHGDQTMLGEQGVNLSGGQKQRISLARAIYSNRDIYLLDDPLCAVDAHIGKHIFEECIKKDLQGKSVILVTHQLQYLEFCDEVLVLKDGSVLETGNHLDLMKMDRHYAELITKHLREPTTHCKEEKKERVELSGHIDRGIVNPAFDLLDENTDTRSPDGTAAHQLIDHKSDTHGPVTWRTFQQYNKAAGGQRYQDELDSLLPQHLNALIIFCLLAISACIVNSIIFPVMMLPVLLLISLFTLLLCFQRLSDVNAHHFLLLHFSMRWLCFLVDALCAVMLLPVALLIIFSSNDIRSPPMKALALCFIIQLTSNSQYLVQSLMEVGVRFISVERLLEYITGCEAEGSGKVDQVPEEWPQQGAITFQDYEMRYHLHSPAVLRGLHLHIRAGEKLGIVGRTGSGKSSLAMALFRLVEPAAGRILIDGVDITSIGLSHLRRKLSIIPQDPILFTGTVRFNLDPFSVHSDEEIWTALEKTYMKDAVSSLDRKLQAELMGDGGTFSVGQRQLMCLSRALLHNSKIVLLDEASASMDAETDSLVQVTIRESFQHCTVLTIAHRIHSVLQADRVLVLHHGQVVEFDHPEVLRQRPDSLFSSLLTAANTTWDQDQSESLDAVLDCVPLTPPLLKADTRSLTLPAERGVSTFFFTLVFLGLVLRLLERRMMLLMDFLFEEGEPLRVGEDKYCMTFDLSRGKDA
ncbi:hypothetical protein INR49_028745, partial [Caranx melampygus]